MANPNAIHNLMNNREAIKRIMALDANGKMDQLAESARENINIDEAGNVTYNAPEKPQRPQVPQQIVVNENVIKKHAHMPKKILESFQKNPGQDGPLPPELGGSVLDGLNIPQQAAPKAQIQESVSTPQVVATTAAPIDYSLLKTIINEAVETNVKKYVSAMYKKLLAESTKNNVKAIKIGEESFSFITENQDIYSCKPKFKRNLND